MQLQKLNDSAGFLDSLRWSAIAIGTVIALAIQTMFLLLGFAFATSLGDREPGGLFGTWAVVVELCAIAIGAALAARLSHAERRGSGIAAGIITWSVVLVLGTLFQGLTMTRALGGSGAWAAFVGAVVSLAAAIVGGALGVKARTPAGTSGEARQPGPDVVMPPRAPAS